MIYPPSYWLHANPRPQARLIDLTGMVCPVDAAMAEADGNTKQ